MFRPRVWHTAYTLRPPARRLVFSKAVVKLIAGVLVNRNGVPQANLSGLSWAFFSVRRPSDIAGAPDASGTDFATDGSGAYSRAIVTSLLVGTRGYLIVSNSNGTDADDANERAFARRQIITAG
jgi:hypothetical protein